MANYDVICDCGHTALAHHGLDGRTARAVLAALAAMGGEGE